jgi:hypothetical protein
LPIARREETPELMNKDPITSVTSAFVGIVAGIIAIRGQMRVQRLEAGLALLKAEAEPVETLRILRID